MTAMIHNSAIRNPNLTVASSPPGTGGAVFPATRGAVRCILFFEVFTTGRRASRPDKHPGAHFFLSVLRCAGSGGQMPRPPGSDCLCVLHPCTAPG